MNKNRWSHLIVLLVDRKFPLRCYSYIIIPITTPCKMLVPRWNVTEFAQFLASPFQKPPISNIHIPQKFHHPHPPLLCVLGSPPKQKLKPTTRGWFNPWPFISPNLGGHLSNPPPNLFPPKGPEMLHNIDDVNGWYIPSPRSEKQLQNFHVLGGGVDWLTSH